LATNILAGKTTPAEVQDFLANRPEFFAGGGRGARPASGRNLVFFPAQQGFTRSQEQKHRLSFKHGTVSDYIASGRSF